MSSRVCEQQAAAIRFPGREPGFTLFEVMILAVAVVIGISLIIPSLRAARMTANEEGCRLFLQQLGAAQARLAAEGGIDRDSDGRAEYGFLEDLLERQLLPSQDVRVFDDGTCARHGYLFRVFLPDAEAGPLAVDHARDVDPKLASLLWLAVAWPETYGRSGIRCFAMNQHRTLVESDNVRQTYSGWKKPPHPLAPLVENASGMASALVDSGGKAHDGQSWFASERTP